MNPVETLFAPHTRQAIRCDLYISARRVTAAIRTFSGDWIEGRNSPAWTTTAEPVLAVASGTTTSAANQPALVVMLLLLMALSLPMDAAAPVARPATSRQGPVWYSVGDALVDGPLPAQEPETALTMLVCHLEPADSCALIEEALLALPWAWHRIGYTVHVDYEPTRPCAWSEPDHHRGCARRAAKQIWVYPDWSYMVEILADIGGDLDMDRAMTTTLRTFAHEIGHTMHQTCSNEQTKLAAYRDARGLPIDTPMRGHGHVDRSNSSVAEDFA